MRQLLRRLAYLLRSRTQDADLADELAFHRAMKADDLEARGLDRVAAQRAAARAFGNELSARQYARDEWIAPVLQELVQDVRFACRLLLRDRWFALTAIVVLGVGIGVNNMMFTLIYTHTMRSLPIRSADRVLYVASIDERAPDRPLSYPEFVDVQAAASCEGVAAYAAAPVAVGEEGNPPSRFEGLYATGNAFDVLAHPPALGRPFRAADDERGAPLVAILGNNAWNVRYQGDPDVLGRTILVNGSPATVIGIMPAQSGFPVDADVVLPLRQMPTLATDRRDLRMLRVFARVRDGVDTTIATQELSALVERSAGDAASGGRSVRARVMPVNTRFLGRPTDPAWMAFLAASFIVVIVSAANVANLMIARSTLRARELAIRASLGASRWRILTQMLTESTVLCVLGGAVALGVSVGGVRLFRSAIPDNTLPYWLDYALDLRVLAALVGVSLATVLIFGLLPAMQASRTDVNRVLKDGGRSASGRSARRLTAAFLTAEFALSVVLLANAVAAILDRAPRVPSDALLERANVVTASLTLAGPRYASAPQRADFYRQLGERLRSNSALAAVSFASVLPVRTAVERPFVIDGVVRDAAADRPGVMSVAIAPGYFNTLEVPIERGREFGDDDGAPGRQQAIVNRRFVDVYLADREPIGTRLRMAGQDGSAEDHSWLTIVGIAQDIRQRPAPAAEPVIYVPLRSLAPPTAALVVRSTIEPAATTALLRKELLAVDANLPLYRAMTLARSIDEAAWNARISARLILSITLVAVAFCVVGLYAVTAHAVRQRTHEIGIRIALGARPAHLRGLVLRRAAMQVAAGMFVGVLLTLGWNALFPGERSDVSFASPRNLAVVGALLAVTVLLACLAPIRRATRLDPVAVLNAE